jgi:NAD(P)H-nitrite reductase large subunit
MKQQSLIECKPDYLVCTCMGVMYTEICAAIQEGDASIKALSERLMIGIGCSSCVPEVQNILDNMRDS